MAVHRKTATLTVDETGSVEEDLRLYPVSSTGRLTQLLFVETSVAGGTKCNLTIREVDDLDEDGEETEGDILLYVDEVDDRRYWVLVSEAVDTGGEAIASQYRPYPVTTNEVRLEVNGEEDEVVTVDVFYETAGDQRF